MKRTSWVLVISPTEMRLVRRAGATTALCGGRDVWSSIGRETVSLCVIADLRPSAVSVVELS